MMKRMVSGLYRWMRRVGHPLLWGGLFAALYGMNHYHERWYQETPSIPFQPFCVQEDDFDPHRPIKGVTMSRAFEKEVVRAMANKRVTIKVVYKIHDEWGTRPNPGPHIFVAPKDFYEPNTMLWVTRIALKELQRKQGKYLEPVLRELDANTVYCKDVEGIISEF